MPSPIEPNLADNLKRWQESGQPRLWIEGHKGQWNHHDWLILLETLKQTAFWPLEPEAVGKTLEHIKAQWWNLHRWQESGQPRQWVAAHAGGWGHADWVALLQSLQQSHFWPLDPQAVGQVLEDLKRKDQNLQRWQESGRPGRWVEAHQAGWGHGDWLALVADLQQSEFWPLDLAAVGAVLEDLRKQAVNLRRWQESGQPRRWVEERQAQWGHDDWLALLDELKKSEFWPLRPGEVGRVLEGLKAERLNLRRWQESDQPRRWVDAHRGKWSHTEWLGFLENLKTSEFWPLPLEAVGKVLETVKGEWWNLHRWQNSNQPRLWVEARAGRWSHEHWLSLLDSLKQSEYWPIPTEAVGRVLEKLVPGCNGHAA